MVLATALDEEDNKYRTEEVACPEGLKAYVEEHFQSESFINMVSIVYCRTGGLIMTTTRKYEEEMDTVITALRTANLMLKALPHDSIEQLRRTVDSADNMAFVMVAPLDFGATTKRLDEQRKVLDWASKTVELFDSLAMDLEAA